ncbi:MAG TPA: minor capsid protein [Candidatus Limnocylindrales bacterium]|nr:minor capsid protein [Candidatus Limnocylindrales bacterium]
MVKIDKTDKQLIKSLKGRALKCIRKADRARSPKAKLERADEAIRYLRQAFELTEDPLLETYIERCETFKLKVQIDALRDQADQFLAQAEEDKEHSEILLKKTLSRLQAILEIEPGNDWIKSEIDRIEEQYQVKFFQGTEKPLLSLKEDWNLRIKFKLKGFQELLENWDGYYQYNLKEDPLEPHVYTLDFKPKDILIFREIYEELKTETPLQVYLDDKLIDEEILTGWLQCYGNYLRGRDPRYCYGATSFSYNFIGCHKAQIRDMESNWENSWFRCGEMDSTLGIFFVDKEQLFLKIQANLLPYTFCPALNLEKLQLGFRLLPNSINPQKDKNWDYVFHKGEKIGVIPKGKEIFITLNRHTSDTPQPIETGATSQLRKCLAILEGKVSLEEIDGDKNLKISRCRSCGYSYERGSTLCSKCGESFWQEIFGAQPNVFRTLFKKFSQSWGAVRDTANGNLMGIKQKAGEKYPENRVTAKNTLQGEGVESLPVMASLKTLEEQKVQNIKTYGDAETLDNLKAQKSEEVKVLSPETETLSRENTPEMQESPEEVITSRLYPDIFISSESEGAAEVNFQEEATRETPDTQEDGESSVFHLSTGIAEIPEQVVESGEIDLCESKISETHEQKDEETATPVLSVEEEGITAPLLPSPYAEREREGLTEMDLYEEEISQAYVPITVPLEAAPEARLSGEEISDEKKTIPQDIERKEEKELSPESVLTEEDLMAENHPEVSTIEETPVLDSDPLPDEEPVPISSSEPQVNQENQPEIILEASSTETEPTGTQPGVENLETEASLRSQEEEISLPEEPFEFTPPNQNPDEEEQEENPSTVEEIIPKILEEELKEELAPSGLDMESPDSESKFVSSVEETESNGSMKEEPSVFGPHRPLSRGPEKTDLYPAEDGSFKEKMKNLFLKNYWERKKLENAFRLVTPEMGLEDEDNENLPTHTSSRPSSRQQTSNRRVKNPKSEISLVKSPLETLETDLIKKIKTITPTSDLSRRGVVRIIYSAIIDRDTCPLCRFLHGMVFHPDHFETEIFKPPLHKGCKCMRTYILSSEKPRNWPEVNFEPPPDELLKYLDPAKLRQYMAQRSLVE